MMVPCGERTAVDLSTKSTLFSEVSEYQTSKKTTRAGFEMNAVGYDGTRSRRSGHTTRRNVRFYHESSDVDDSPESNKHEGHLVKRVQGAQQKSPEQSQKPIATTQPSRPSQNPTVLEETDYTWRTNNNWTVSRPPPAIETPVKSKSRTS